MSESGFTRFKDLQDDTVLSADLVRIDSGDGYGLGYGGQCPSYKIIYTSYILPENQPRVTKGKE